MQKTIGGAAIFQHLDVPSDASWVAAMRQGLDRFERLGAVVNNAGVTLPGSIETLSLQDWQRTLDIDLTGVFVGCRHAVAAMKTQGGRIITFRTPMG